MKQFRAWVLIMWRPFLVILAMAVILSLILGFKIGSLTSGVSEAETEYIASATTIDEVLNAPSFLPHKFTVFGANFIGIKSISVFRAISAVFAAVAVVCCFFILREWYSDRIAVLGTWLLLSSAWMLHIGRSATPEVSFLLLFPLLWSVMWLQITTLRKSAWISVTFFTAASVYIPGFIWVLFVAAVWQRKTLIKELKAVPTWFRIFCILLILIVLLPWAWAIYHDSHQLLAALALPSILPNIKELGQQLLTVPAHLLWQGPNDPSRWLGRLPILDIFSTVMLILGAYSLRFHISLNKVRLLLATSLIFIVLITIGGIDTITPLIPMVYLLIAGGIAYMLKQWFSVFPRNPLARTLATTLMSLIVLLVSYYHISHYFIAWPRTPDTKSSFSYSLVK